MDKAHNQTDAMLAETESRIAALYRKSRKQIVKEVVPLLDGLVLDDEEATQTKRLKYAEKDGKKDEAIGKAVDIIVSANERTTELINQNAKQIYAVNFQFACDEIIRQIKGGG